jgi:bifunctional DNA-binding transcriptional regulator/antitoxin component of YhaV-PrlF toxin-antitoxin module
MMTKNNMEKILGKPRQLDNRNRITLPPELLKLLDLKSGDEVYFKIKENKITIGKAIVKYEFIDEIINRKKNKN